MFDPNKHNETISLYYLISQHRWRLAGDIKEHMILRESKAEEKKYITLNVSTKLHDQMFGFIRNIQIIHLPLWPESCPAIPLANQFLNVRQIQSTNSFNFTHNQPTPPPPNAEVTQPPPYQYSQITHLATHLVSGRSSVTQRSAVTVFHQGIPWWWMVHSPAM